MLPDAIFLDEAIANLDAIDAELCRVDAFDSPDSVHAMFRQAHSVKGGAAAFGLDAVADLLHLIESVLDVPRQSGNPPELGTADLLREAVDAARHMLVDGGFPPAPAVLQELAVRLRDRALVPAASQGSRLRRITVRSSESDIVSAAVVGFFNDIAGLGELVSSDAGVSDERIFVVRTAVCDQELLDLLAMHVERRHVTFDVPTSLPSAKPAMAEPSVGLDAIGGMVRVHATELRRLVLIARRLTEGDVTPDGAAGHPGGSVGAQSAGLEIAQWQCDARALREGLEKLASAPVSTVFSRIAPLLRRLSVRLNKQFVLSVRGDDLQMDRALLQRLADPLTHLVRNACDHGIELPAQRLSVGKPTQGHIEVSAWREPGLVRMSVRDDGAGLSREKVLQAALVRAVPVPVGLDDQGVWQLVFEQGLTTVASVSDVSGRGVGMDVVRRQVVALGGDVSITSCAGQGACVTMSIPVDEAGGRAMIG